MRRVPVRDGQEGKSAAGALDEENRPLLTGTLSSKKYLLENFPENLWSRGTLAEIDAWWPDLLGRAAEMWGRKKEKALSERFYAEAARLSAQGLARGKEADKHTGAIGACRGKGTARENRRVKLAEGQWSLYWALEPVSPNENGTINLRLSPNAGHLSRVLGFFRHPGASRGPDSRRELDSGFRRNDAGGP